MSGTLIELDGIDRVYGRGDTRVQALSGVSLRIDSGEYVAIMGRSGSGKSTLMNIIGCLDRPSAGSYRVRGVDVAGQGADDLARLRRDTFGFVFQRYNLLSAATALENVEVPAIYAGARAAERHGRARDLLTALGLGERVHHRPSELSGGQQQRVSIARSLMNGADVILADEPTGALDTASSADLLDLFDGLNAEGRTIVVITHDASVAARARRVVEIEDGCIRRDQPSGSIAPAPVVRRETAAWSRLQQCSEAVKLAFRSLGANPFRTSLTLLGVVIGVAAVVAMLALGEGSRRDIVESIETMGSDLLFVRPGAPGTRPRGDAVATLTLADADALGGLDNVRAAVATRRDSSTLRVGSVDYRSSVEGVTAEWPLAQDWPLAEGAFFTTEDQRRRAAVVVLGATVADNLFGAGVSAVGHFVLVGGVPFEVVGVLSPRGATAWGNDQDDIVLVPITTGMMRLFGQGYLSSITVAVNDTARIDATEAAARDLLLARHGTEDFQLRNTAALLESVEQTQQSFSVLLGSVAAISLLVGGIGVMNIMLVSVTERTREIGVRMATGARQSDIMLQFITEALVLGGVGGMAGVLLGLGASVTLAEVGIPVAIRPEPAMLAFASAMITGLVFGWLPAREAARLDPVTALATE